MKKLKFYLIALTLTFTCCNSEETQIKPKSTSSQYEEIMMCTADLMNLKNNLSSKVNAVIEDWRWSTGQTIKIKFLDGNSDQQEKVKNIASEWTKYANLNFEYVGKDEYADIRIGFDLTGADNRYGSWSEVGAKTAYIPQQKQTMRLGNLEAKEVDNRHTILHEFGHALGLHHETTNPAANIKWNLKATYEWYGSVNGWPKELVDYYVINPAKVTNYTEYDPLSIMNYRIHKSLTTDGFAVNDQSELSIIDMQSINKWYPFPIRSVIESGERIDFIPWQQSVKSPNGKYELHFFNNGSLSIIDLTTNTFVWDVGNHGTYNKQTSCHLEANGNLIIKGARTHTIGATKYTVWSSNTAEFPGAKLHLQDDGDLVLLFNETIKWSSKSGKL